MKKSFLALSSLALASLSLFASNASALSLAEGFVLALDNDLEYARAAETLEASVAKSNSAYSAVLPSVAFSYNWSLQRDLSLSKQFQNQLSAVDLALKQNIFNFAEFLKLNIALKQKRQAQTTYITARQDLINRYIATYINVVKAQDAYDLAQSSYQNAAKTASTADVRYRKGLISLVDNQLAQARVESAIARLEGSKVALSKAQADLETMVGRDADLSVLRGMKIDAQPHLPYPTDVASSIANNLSLKSLAMTVEIARLGTKVGIAALFPTITLQGKISNSPRNTVQLGEKGWASAHQVDKLYIGINLTMPVFAGGQIYNGIKQASSQYKQAEYSYKLAYRQIENGFKTNLQMIKVNETAWKAAKIGYQAGDLGYKAKKSAFGAGLATINDVFLAEEQLRQSRETYNNARYNYISSIIQQKLLAGSLTEADLKELDKFFDVEQKIGVNK